MINFCRMGSIAEMYNVLFGEILLGEAERVAYGKNESRLLFRGGYYHVITAIADSLTPLTLGSPSFLMVEKIWLNADTSYWVVQKDNESFIKVVADPTEDNPHGVTIYPNGIHYLSITHLAASFLAADYDGEDLGVGFNPSDALFGVSDGKLSVLKPFDYTSNEEEIISNLTRSELDARTNAARLNIPFVVVKDEEHEDFVVVSVSEVLAQDFSHLPKFWSLVSIILPEGYTLANKTKVTEILSSIMEYHDATVKSEIPRYIDSNHSEPFIGSLQPDAY